MWVALASVGIAVLTLARGIVLTRLLTPEIFGLMAIALMSTRLIDVFTETGFGVRGLRLITTVLVPVSVAMLVLAPEIVEALYGGGWVFGCRPSSRSGDVRLLPCVMAA